MSKLRMNWTGGSQGKGEYVRESDNEAFSIAVPTDRGGSGEGFEPRELLGSASGACFSTTLVNLMEVRKLPVTEFSMETDVVKIGDNYEFTHYPKITLSSEATDKEYSAVERSITYAEKECTIGKLLKSAGVKITTKQEISIG